MRVKGRRCSNGTLYSTVMTDSIGDQRVGDRKQTGVQRMTRKIAQHTYDTWWSSNELDSTSGEYHHLQQQPPVLPATDIGLAVSSIPVSDRQIQDLEIQLCRAKKQIEVPEWIEVTEVRTIGHQRFIILAPHRLGAAECIFEGLTQQPGKRDAKKLIADQIEETHGTGFHRINQARAIRKLRLTGSQDLDETRQLLRRHSQVGVENHQNIPSCMGEAEAHGVALAFAFLLE